MSQPILIRTRTEESDRLFEEAYTNITTGPGRVEFSWLSNDRAVDTVIDIINKNYLIFLPLDISNIENPKSFSVVRFERDDRGLYSVYNITTEEIRRTQTEYRRAGRGRFNRNHMNKFLQYFVEGFMYGQAWNVYLTWNKQWDEERAKQCRT